MVAPAEDWRFEDGEVEVEVDGERRHVAIVRASRNVERLEKNMFGVVSRGGRGYGW